MESVDRIEKGFCLARGKMAVAVGWVLQRFSHVFTRRLYLDMRESGSKTRQQFLFHINLLTK